MADRPFDTPLPADLPEDWTSGQIVAPAGADVGLSQQHGYNYQSKQINAAHRAINQIADALENGNIENIVTVDGSGHITMEGSLGNPPYSITMTEEVDEPLTAEDVGAIPLPDDPKKGQALIFDGDRWIPGDITTDLPTDYFRVGRVVGRFSAEATTETVYFHNLFGANKANILITLLVRFFNDSDTPTDGTISLIGAAGETVVYQKSFEVRTGSVIYLTGVAGRFGEHIFLGDYSGRGYGLKFSSSAGVGYYEIKATGIGADVV